MKAPTKEKVREEQKEKIVANKEKLEKLAIQNKNKNKIEEADKVNATRIIKQLSEMFQNKNVSNKKGCSICGIPSEICSEGVLVIINEYLDGEWLAKFESNTGNSHDFEMTNTLRVKPSI